jgi:antibiotic biosynthesis monooxygenase (ABM) superfamily enzyme
MSIIYEVNLFVQRKIEAEYRAWLAEHIVEILALPGFIDAQCFDVQQEADAEIFTICVQYRLQSQAALDNYLEQHATRLRAEGVRKFGDRFHATRRVLITTQ